MDILWKGYIADTPGCKMPFYDPYHWTIESSSHLEAYDYDGYCSVGRPNVVRQEGNVFTLDEDELYRGYNVSANETECFYREVLRNMSAVNPDLSPILGPRKSDPFNRQLRDEYVQISCEANETVLFSDFFFIPAEKRNIGGPLLPGQLNVLMLALDSTSRLNFNRRMARTRRYLVEEHHAFEFLMYNKVGMNSFPNHMPLLAGLSGPDASSLFRNKHFDSLPAIWTVYKSLGYKTLFVEEMPYWGIFTGTSGFKSAPTDYYPQPMMFMMDNGTGSVKCMGSRLKTKEVLKYAYNVLEMNRDRRMFSYLSIAYHTHDRIEDVAYMDAPFEEFFRNLSASGVLDRTAVLFFSDHGMRFGSIRRTEVGRHEDKTPFGLWVLPSHFLDAHPDAAVWLEVNQRRLVTAYDFHATLLSLASLPALSVASTNKGLSLFGAVPAERTCEDAFIPAAFCACVGADRRLDDEKTGLSFAMFVVAYINALAERYFPGKCATWRLDHVYEATVLGGGVAGKVLIRIGLKTQPEAYFEVYGGLRNASSWEKYVDYIDRVDRYQKHTTCLEKSAWQKVCSCRF
ncbi:uncharacterized protein LOC144134542 [Amblyomma americanum]